MLSVSCKRALPRTVRNRRKFFPEKNLRRVPGGAVEIFSATKRTRAGSAALLEGFGRFSFCAVGGDYHSGSSSRRGAPRLSAPGPKKAEKPRFFREATGRMDICHMACVPFEKARWGRDGGLGGKDYKNAFPSERLGPLAPAATEGGRRPCPLRRRKLRASTAEMRGVPSPKQLTKSVNRP